MSLLWPNRLQIVLSAQGAAILSMSAGASNTKLMQTFLPATKTHQLPIWQAACSNLDALFTAIQVKPSTHLTVVLSTNFVRYQLLPAQEISMNSAEKLAYATVAYKEIYGAEVEDWKIKLYDTGFKQASIAAAIDQSFLKKLQQISQQYKIKLTSVQPSLMYAYNVSKAQVSKLSGYFVMIEANKILLLNLHQGQFQNLRINAISSNWQQDLKQLLTRESMLNQESGKEVLIFAPANQNRMKIEGWQVSHVNTVYEQRAPNNSFTTHEATI